MKKLIVMASLLLGAMFSANAQDKEGLGLDIKAGADIASFSGGGASINATGFGLGVAYNIAASEKLSIAPGLGYTSLTFDFLGMDLKASQLQIPVTAKYAISDNISGLVGAKYGMFLDKDFKDGMDKSANLSLEAGAAYGFTESLFGEVKYAYGLTDFGGAKLNGFLISVGYKL